MSDKLITNTYTFNGKPTVFAQSPPRKKKGSEEQSWFMYPHLETPDAVAEFVNGNIPTDKFWSTIFREVIKPAAADVYGDCIEADDEGNPRFNSAKFTELFLEQFEPASRRSTGPSSSELKDRLAAITSELAVAFAESSADPADEGKKMRLNKLVLEMTELSNKLEAKKRTASTTPRKPRKKKEEKVEETAEAAA